MAKNGTCGYCGKSGPVDMRFGINYCPDCLAAIKAKNYAYFEEIGQEKATKEAIADVTSTVYPEEVKQMLKRDKLIAEANKQDYAKSFKEKWILYYRRKNGNN